MAKDRKQRLMESGSPFSERPSLMSLTNSMLSEDEKSTIVSESDGSLAYKRFRMTATRLIAPETVTEDEITEIGSILTRLESGVQFWLGDWANLYVNLVGAANQFDTAEAYDNLADQFGIDKQTLKDYAWVCRRIDASLRNDALSFNHHRLVANDRFVDRAHYLLEYAAANSLSVRAFREYLATPSLPAPDAEEWLFRQDSIPRVDRRFQRLWMKARNGDSAAKQALLDTVSAHRKWLDDLENSLKK